MSVRAAIDSNVLVYAELEPKSEKGVVAHDVIAFAARDGVIALQALLEFVAVVRRRRIASLPSALQKVEAWSATFRAPPMTPDIADAALALVRDHNFQVWDAVILSASAAAGAQVFLSEDLHEGFALGAMRVVNPFAMAAGDLRAMLY